MLFTIVLPNLEVFSNFKYTDTSGLFIFFALHIILSAILLNSDWSKLCMFEFIILASMAA